jgi:anthraniloyl-CoA monooxygenase
VTRIGVIGGGPAGLYLARLICRRSPRTEVEVFERNASDSTFGFGVAFSQATLANLEAADAQTYAAIVRASRSWDGMMLRHAGRAIRWDGFGLDAIARVSLLDLLQSAAAAAGARLHFESEVTVEDLADYDVVVAADGANSQTRASLAAEFGTSIELGQVRYMWLGSTGPFDRTTFCVRTDEAGTYAIHAYPYADERATMVAEVDERTWQRAGLAAHAGAADAPGVSDERSVRHLAEVFESDLAGHEVLVNNSKWLRFPTVRNQRWSSANLVLMGDAAHTAHPSVASGTKLAMEDAIVLADELARGAAVREAFARYQDRRRPDVEHVQMRAHRSQRWWETLHHRTSMTAEQLAFSYVTRAGAADYRKLQRVAPTLTASALRSLDPDGDPGDGAGPLELPADLAGRRFAGRVLRAARAGPGEPCVRVLPESDLPAARNGHLIAADLPMSAEHAAGDPAAAVELARQLAAAGCDAVVLPSHAPGALAEAGERIRIETGLPTVGRRRPDELDHAATDVLAGRIDLVELVEHEEPPPRSRVLFAA